MIALLSQYMLVDAFCLILAFIVLWKTRHGTIREISYSYFALTTCSIIIYILGDAGFAIVEYADFPGRTTLGYVIMSIYYVAPAVLSFCWYMFTEARIDKKSAFMRNGWVAALPILVLTVLVIISDCGSHLVFSYDKGVYERGALYPIALILEYISALFAIGHTLFIIMRRRQTMRPDNLGVLLSFAVFPLLFGVLQIIFYSLPLECVGFALMLVTVLLDLKETEIMQDSLTQMNNRRCLNRYVENLFKQRAVRNDFFLCMIDVDGFKNINDTYGHVSGDEALIATAGVIKDTVKQFNGFAARFGGDEFVVVCHGENKVHPENFGKQLNDDLLLAAADAGLPYPLHLTVGFIRFDAATMKNANDVIKSADKYLYHNKAKNKAE